MSLVVSGARLSMSMPYSIKLCAPNAMWNNVQRNQKRRVGWVLQCIVLLKILRKRHLRLNVALYLQMVDVVWIEFFRMRNRRYQHPAFKAPEFCLRLHKIPMQIQMLILIRNKNRKSKRIRCVNKIGRMKSIAKFHFRLDIFVGDSSNEHRCHWCWAYT